jgi:hypothetical protein
VTKVSSARNKARGKQDERDIAERLGGRRHPADTGGCEDVEHDFLVIQVKGGLKVINNTIRDGLASARAGAAGQNKLPCVAVVDRSGTRIQRYIVFGLEEWAAWNGLPKQEEAKR